MDFLEQMQSYFRAERRTGILVTLTGLGLVALAAGAWWHWHDHFAQGLALSLLVVATLALMAGLALVLKTPAQVRALINLYESNGAGLVATEGERMEKVVRNFRYYRMLFVAAIAVALLLPGLWPGALANGIAAGLACFAALGVTVDTFAERRARVYLDAILDLP